MNTLIQDLRDEIDSVESSLAELSKRSRERARPVDSMRVLHLINGEHFSGAERVQQLLGKRLGDFEIDPRFVCLKPGKFTACSGLDPTTIEVMPMRGRFDLSIAKRVSGHAFLHRVSLLHAHTPRTALIASIAASRCGIPWIYHVHSPTARDSTRALLNHINHYVERWALRRANHIITVSKSLRREMLSRGFSRTRISTIANGVAKQECIDAIARKSSNEWRLGMIALVRPRKGIEVLLEAMHLLPPSAQHITLDVIGGFETTEYEASVRALIAKYRLESRVHLRGFTNDVPSALRELDAMVLPSLFGEGMPMVVLEALALGVPVIATRVEGTPEVVRDGREGILAEPRSAASLADAIVRFTADRNQWCRMSSNAWMRHRGFFTDHRMAESTAKLYRKVVLFN